VDEIFEKLISLIVALPILLLILAVHEYGHYIVARCFGVRLSEFSLGYGKKIWQKTGALKQNYIIRRYPISAHVALNEADYKVLPFFKKLFVILAGPIFNLIFSFIALFALTYFIGLPSKPPVFNALEKGLPAFEAGLKQGDRILAVNGKKIQRYEDLLEYTYDLPVKMINLTLERKGRIFNRDITPKRYDYINRDGLSQSHGRLGVLNFHGPFSLEIIKAVNGQPTKNENQTRDLLLKFLDQNIVLTIESGDDQLHDYHAWLDGGLNQPLTDPNQEHYDDFYLGKIGDHFYLPQSLQQSFVWSGMQTFKMIGDIATIPYQLFPLDKKKVKPETRVYGEATKIKNGLYKYGFFAALASIVVGLINLLPVPYFDGGQLVTLVYEKVTKRKITPQRKFYLFTILLGGLYLSMLIPNANNMPNYIAKQTKKIQNFVDETF